MPESPAYILRLKKDELKTQLFGQRTVYVGVSRDWSHGTLVLFISKDLFIGSGLIDRFVAIDFLEDCEKKDCLKNNWYGKIVFARLSRFVPGVPVLSTLAAGQKPLALHGSSIAEIDALQIEEFAAARIIS
jgi:hypothetical protein